MNAQATRPAPVAPQDASALTLHDVPWNLYVQLRDLDANSHLRMTYHDGTLIFVSLQYIHERSSQRLGMLVRLVAAGLGIDVAGTGTTTLRRKGVGPRKGSGKEPDNAFYVGPNERLIRRKSHIDLKVDPPPDLAIEVDNKGDSEIALPSYVRIGVLEIWRYDVTDHTLWFGRLTNGSYETIDRSLCLPVLTPELIIQALDAFDDDDMSETKWIGWLREWIPGLPAPPAA